MAKRGNRLNQQYERFCEKSSLIWVKVSYLRHLNQVGELLPRRQDIPAEQLVSGTTGIAVSSPWLSVEHPDPAGTQLQTLVRKLNTRGKRVGDNVGVFWDYCCLPQHATNCPALRQEKPGAQPECDCLSPQDRQIRQWALGAHCVAGICWIFRCNAVVVLPVFEPLESKEFTLGHNGVLVTPRNVAYGDRGWCLLEFAIASFYQTLQFDDDVARFYGKISFDPVKATAALDQADYSLPSDQAHVVNMWSRLMAGERIHDAILQKGTDEVKELIEAKADVNVALQGGVSPLHLAAVVGDLAITKLLVRNRADITARDEHGDTPFDDAMREDHKHIARYLVQVSISGTLGQWLLSTVLRVCNICNPAQAQPLQGQGLLPASKR